MASLTLSPEIACMAAFRTAVPFGNGPSDTADRLCAIGRYRGLARGQELRADPEEDRLVFIAEGCAKLAAKSSCASAGQACSSTTNTHILAFHFPGEIVSVLRRSDGDFRLVALVDLDLVAFPSIEFLDIAQDDPVVLRSVLSRSLEALHRSRTKMMRLGHKSARQRIADFLVSMAERLEGRTAGACEFALPMSRRDIGDSLGLKIETVSRQFTELREAGLIETEGRSHVRLTDIAALAEEAGRTPIREKPPQN
ncbi:helix-turn-helix domain-containing protein [Erythrobacter sp. JK5]|uniref:helix-turn-helix domain-containing protein n=1 Tax=Erythrobacter sp. JK5 TaxID=2829500 RepID=UPI001BA6FC4C|nr:helix-turn-helix domain-containing protein [Erythrobacter sp. JK5]QUL38008.1 helix-turn-helix domain-containing protein [Erythrobacter sp. JK5]